MLLLLYRVGQKTGPVLTCITLVYNDIRRSVYQNIQLFIRSTNGDIQNISLTLDEELNILIY